MGEERVTERTVPLEYPVEHDDVTYEGLHLRRITAKDALALDKVSQQTQGLALIAIIARVPIPVIEKLDIDDWEEVQRAAVPFMPKTHRRAYEAGFKAIEKLDEDALEKLMAKLVDEATTSASE